MDFFVASVKVGGGVGGREGANSAVSHICICNW